MVVQSPGRLGDCFVDAELAVGYDGVNGGGDEWVSSGVVVANGDGLESLQVL